MIVGLFGLVFYGAFQFVPTGARATSTAVTVTRSPRAGRFDPAGQLGRAFGAADDVARRRPPGTSLLGSLWLPFLWAAFMSSTHPADGRRPRRRVGGRRQRRSPTRATIGRFVRRACGSGACGRDRLAQPAHPLPHATHGARDVHRRRRRSRRRARADAHARHGRQWRRARRRRDPARRAVHVGQQLRLATVRRSRTSCSPAPISSMLVRRQGAQHRHRRRAAGRDRARPGGGDHAASGEYLVGRHRRRRRRTAGRHRRGHRAVGDGADRDPRVRQPVRQRRVGQGDDGCTAAVVLCSWPWRSSRCRSRWR